jgi:alpha-galactosidase/6-phospho-beta-glucosidase family protein
VNHLGWFDELQCDDVDAIEALAAGETSDAFPSAELIGRLRAIPLSYLELHYLGQRVVHRQRSSAPRAAYLQNLAQRAILSYASADAAKIADMLALRTARWYYSAVAPLLACLRGENVETTFFLSAPNRGYLSGFHDDDTLEIPHVFQAGKFERRNRTKVLSLELKTTLESFVQFERLAAPAILNREPSGITEALLHHPWVPAQEVHGLTRAIVRDRHV